MAIFLFVYELKVYGCTTETSMGQLLYILNILNKFFGVCVGVLRPSQQRGHVEPVS